MTTSPRVRNPSRRRNSVRPSYTVILLKRIAQAYGEEVTQNIRRLNQAGYSFDASVGISLLALGEREKTIQQRFHSPRPPHRLFQAALKELGIEQSSSWTADYVKALVLIWQRGLIDPPKRTSSSPPTLDLRQSQVLKHLAMGFSVQEIARQLMTDAPTAATEVLRGLRSLLGADNSVELLINAVRQGALIPATPTTSLSVQKPNIELTFVGDPPEVGLVDNGKTQFLVSRRGSAIDQRLELMPSVVRAWRILVSKPMDYHPIPVANDRRMKRGRRPNGSPKAVDVLRRCLWHLKTGWHVQGIRGTDMYRLVHLDPFKLFGATGDPVRRRIFTPTVSVDDIPITVFRMLAVLANARRPVSRQEITRYTWGESPVNSGTYLRVHNEAQCILRELKLPCYIWGSRTEASIEPEVPPRTQMFRWEGGTFDPSAHTATIGEARVRFRETPGRLFATLAEHTGTTVHHAEIDQITKGPENRRETLDEIASELDWARVPWWIQTVRPDGERLEHLPSFVVGDIEADGVNRCLRRQDGADVRLAYLSPIAYLTVAVQSGNAAVPYFGIPPTTRQPLAEAMQDLGYAVPEGESFNLKDFLAGLKAQERPTHVRDCIEL